MNQTKELRLSLYKQDYSLYLSTCSKDNENALKMTGLSSALNDVRNQAIDAAIRAAFKETGVKYGGLCYFENDLRIIIPNACITIDHNPFADCPPIEKYYLMNKKLMTRFFCKDAKYNKSLIEIMNYDPRIFSQEPKKTKKISPFQKLHAEFILFNANINHKKMTSRDVALYNKYLKRLNQHFKNTKLEFIIEMSPLIQTSQQFPN